MSAASIGTPALWIGFIVFILAMLALDLGVFHRKAHAVKIREALIWSVVWIALALCLQCSGLFLVWTRAGSGIFDRLPDRKSFIGRQLVCLPGPLFLFCRADATPASGAFLGYRWSTDHASWIYCGRRNTDPEFSLGDLHFWRFSGIYGI